MPIVISGIGVLCARSAGCATIDERMLAAALGSESRRMLSRETTILLGAARLALANAGVQSDAARGDRVGVVVSTRYAGLQDYAELLRAGIDGGRKAVNPARGPQTGLNAPAAHLSIRWGASGPNATLCNGAAGGLDALRYAVDALNAHSASMMIVGGVDVLPRVVCELLHNSAQPVTARPFDHARRGPALSEAGVVAVLEHSHAVTRRGGTGLAEIGAIATAFAPDGDLTRACSRALGSALEAGSLHPRAVGGVFAAANGSVHGDAAEASALHELFGASTSVYAVKGAVGECAGAGALVQVAAAVTAMRQGKLPPTLGFERLSTDMAPIRVTTVAQLLDRGPTIVHCWDETCYAAAAVLHACELPETVR